MVNPNCNLVHIELAHTLSLYFVLQPHRCYALRLMENEDVYRACCSHEQRFYAKKKHNEIETHKN